MLPANKLVFLSLAVFAGLVWSAFSSDEAYSQAPSAFEVGVEVDGDWIIEEVIRHPEFVRIKFQRGDGDTSIEMTSGVVAGSEDREFVVQPGPNSSLVPELATWVGDNWTASDFAPEEDSSAGSTEHQTGSRPSWESTRRAEYSLGILLLLAVWKYRAAIRRVPTAEFGVFLATLLGCLAIFAFATPDPFLFGDPIRDLHIARSCNIGVCPRGASTSIPGIAQGTLWPRLVGGLLGVGVPVSKLPVCVNALNALAVGVAAVLVWREKRGVLVVVAVVALGIWAAISLDAVGMFWNPSLVPLASMVAACALVRAIRTGETSDWVAVGITAWIVGEAHIIGILLVPISVAIACWRSRTPYLAAPAVAVPAIVALVLVSPSTARSLVEVHEFAPLMVTLAFVGAGGVGLFARRRKFIGKEVWIYASVAALFGLAAIVRLSSLGTDPRYAAPGFGYAIAAISQLVFSRRAQRLSFFAGGVALLACLIDQAATTTASTARLLRFDDVEVVRVLGEFGDPTTLAWTLHSRPDTFLPLTLSLLDPFSASAGEPREEGAADHPEAVTALFMEAAPEPGAGWRWTPFEGAGGLAVRSYDPWVQRTAFVVSAQDGLEHRFEIETAPERRPRSRPEYIAMSLQSLDRPIWTFEFPIEAGPGSVGESRMIALVEDRDCRREIVEVRNVEFVGELPSTEIEILGQLEPGSLLVRLPEGCSPFIPPMWVEIAELTPALRQAISAP